MTEQYEGQDIVDASGDKIGRVEASYEDDSGNARYVEVKTGSLLGKHRLVPVDDLEHSDSTLAVPYEKRVVENSPEVSPRNEYLEDDTLARVRAYYEGVHTRLERDRGQVAEVGDDQGQAEPDTPSEEAASVPVARSDTEGDAPATEAKEPATSAAVDDAASIGGVSGQRIGEVRDLGDVIEIPIIEEQLVKRPVVKEVLRIRKTQRVETQEVSTDVRREDVEVDSQPEQVVRQERQAE